MALFISGKTCKICQKPIENQDDLILFPAFVSNENDPLRLFSDGAFHKTCFLKHPLAGRAEAQLQNFSTRMGPGHRKCAVCNLEIVEPDNYLPTGYLTDDQTDPLSTFNYLHLHRTCLTNFQPRQSLIGQLKARLDSGEWKGRGLEWLVMTLQNP
jgi:hypothetical protein